MYLINLNEPDGNAFALMGYARKIAREKGIDPSPIINDMMSGDYDNLLEVFRNSFEEGEDFLFV